jgi:hypothetical protein
MTSGSIVWNLVRGAQMWRLYPVDGSHDQSRVDVAPRRIEGGVGAPGNWRSVELVARAAEDVLEDGSVESGDTFRPDPSKRSTVSGL